MIPTFRFCIKEVTCNRFMSYMNRQARILDKLIKKGSTPKKPSSLPSSNIISKQFLFQTYQNENCSHRVTVLNKAYMEHINELLNGGKYCQELKKLEIEVTKVSLTKACNILNIYFISKNPATRPQIIKETLKGAIAELQAKMGEFRYLDKVPYLRFVRDKMLENAVRLDKVFQDLDFGRNYEPVNESKVFTERSPVKEGLPEMREDVFGVDVAQIKGKIKASLTRSKAINIETSGSDMCPEYDIPHKLMEFNKKDFIKFFKSRRIRELKNRKLAQRQMNVMKNEDEEEEEEEEEEKEYDFDDYEYFLKDEDYEKDKNMR